MNETFFDHAPISSHDKKNPNLLNIARTYFPRSAAEEKIGDFESWAKAYGGGWLFTREIPESRLLEISDCPPVLFFRGNRNLLDSKRAAIAIVGTRRPSAYGIRAAIHFSRALVRQGLVVVSGLARGIDAAAHHGALEAGGDTIAVLGHGLDRIYPAAHRGLSESILAAGGCLISEYPPGVPPLQHHFPRRNRIISGLSLGSVVIQAAEKSGSLITARHALEQNREVFIVPGDFDDTSFAGSHRLIQEGAKLVRSADDIVEEFSFLLELSTRNRESEQSSALPPGIAQMQALFVGESGPVSAESLLSRNIDLSTITDALTSGKIVEVYPQHFIWLGN